VVKKHPDRSPAAEYFYLVAFVDEDEVAPEHDSLVEARAAFKYGHSGGSS